MNGLTSLYVKAFFLKQLIHFRQTINNKYILYENIERFMIVKQFQ